MKVGFLIKAVLVQRGGRVLPTHLRPSCPRRRLVGSPRKRSFASDFWSCSRTGSNQFVEQRFCLLQVGSFGPLGEPAVNGRPQVARFGPPALFKLRSGRAIGGEPFAQLVQRRSPACFK